MLKTFLWGKVGKYGLLCLSLQRWIKGELRWVGSCLGEVSEEI